MDLLFILLY